MSRCTLFSSNHAGFNQQRGFTLVEVVIAIALFALIALVGWQLVDQLQTTQIRGEAASQKQSELVAFHSSLMSDLQLLAPRVQGALINAEEGSLSFLFRLASPPKLNSSAEQSAEDIEEFTPNPVLQQVSYRLLSNGLFRESSPVEALSPQGRAGFQSGLTFSNSLGGADSAQSVDQLESTSTELIAEISELNFTLVPFEQTQNSARRFAQLASGQSRQEVFPGAPSLLRVSFSYQGLSYEWVFALPAYGLLKSYASGAQN